MYRLDSSLFDWITWRSGSIWNIFKIRHRAVALLENKKLIRKYAIGYCNASQIPCRPKANHVAVMFDTGEGYTWWTHFKNYEFNTIFKEKK